jgi:ElaB/YqjD/DUF883 family membrane-anchored ribosome-binding protein
MGIFRRRKTGVKKIAAQLDSLQSELSALRKDARELVNGVGEVAGSAVDAAQGAYSDVGKWTKGNIASARHSVRNQPLAACLVSLGAGAVLGALFLRR